VVESEQIFFTIIALIKVFPPSENEPAFAARAVENIATKQGTRRLEKENDSSMTRVLAGSSEKSEEEKGEMRSH
jgi:hypothetical protein